MSDIVNDIHDFDLGAFESPRKALAALACLADEAADEIERLRGLLTEALETRLTPDLRRRIREALGDE